MQVPIEVTEQAGPGAARLVLASASPARRHTLQAAGIEPDVLVSGVDETVPAEWGPAETCLELAGRKAMAVADRLRRRAPVPSRPADGGPGGPRTLVLGCDSVLAFAGEVFGKPADAAEATRRWRLMRGRVGVLYTGHCVLDLVTGRRAAAAAATTVHFAEVTDEEIAAYVATGEPLQVAGAFTIDGIGGTFVERIEGDPGTVIGLSLPLLRQLLAQLDVKIITLWSAAARSGTARAGPD